VQDRGQRSARRRGRLGAVLRVLFGLVVLALVARTLPWSDELVFRAGEGKDARSLELAGQIEGPWTGDAVVFRVEPGQAADPAWPAEARAAAAAGGALSVRRGPFDPALGGAYDWRPSMPRAFREMDPKYLARAFLFFTLAMSCAVSRWWRLLALVGCRTSWLNAWRLTFLGTFFNLVVPGLTGGDVVKGVIVAHENPGRRSEALVSVVVDRLIGIVALAVLALAVILCSGDAFAELRLPVLLFVGAAVAGAACYVSRPLRRLVRFDALLARLPFSDKLRALDQAVLTYGSRPPEIALAFAVSLMNHALVTLGFVALGRAFAVSGVSLREYFVLVPIGNMVTALPLAPGGWGLGEATFKMLFEMSGGEGSLGVAVSVTFRLCQLVYGLVGGVFLLLPSARTELHASEAEAQAEG
jgi:uncharacterized protein (TIRG00374 family)